LKKIVEINLKPHLNIGLLKSFFNNLELDTNDIKLYNLNPFRKRQILYTEYNNGILKIINKKSFIQNVNDSRKKERKFSVLKPTDKQLILLKKVLEIILKKAKKSNFNVTSKLDVTFHFVKIIATQEGSSNSPEGIHRDGYDILVPCLVIERKNIEGGSSRFFVNKKLVFDKVMNEGRGIIVEENVNKELFHDVTPIKLKDSNKEGYRCIVGVDINYVY